MGPVSRHLFLYYGSATGTERDDVEEVVTAALDGHGEVTGAGSGLGLVNLDVEIFDADIAADVLRQLDRRVAALGLPDGAFWQWANSNERVAVGSG